MNDKPMTVDELIDLLRICTNCYISEVANVALRAAIERYGREQRGIGKSLKAVMQELGDIDLEVVNLQDERGSGEPVAQSDEIERLTVDLAAANASAAWCEKHKPNGGARGRCVICAGEALSAALSKISYLCSEPNEMECSPYDVHCDELAVVSQVGKIIAERDAANAALDELRADAERYRWLRTFWKKDHFATESQPDGDPAACDAAIDAARALRKGTT